MTELRVISGGKAMPNLWAQRPTEDEAEYLLFLGWLHLASPRPGPDYPAIASHNEWTERANAYDSTYSMPGTPTGKAARAWRDLEDVFCAEARKLANDVKKTSDGRILTVKDIITLGVVMADNREALKRILDAEDDDELDMTSLSEEELRALQLTKKALGKIGKGKK